MGALCMELGEVQPGDETPHKSGEDLPQQRDVSVRLVTALAVEQSEEWVTGRRYLDIEELKQERSRERVQGEVVFTER
jgi:hypothetical protein